MPKLCEACKFYSADNSPTACPTCSGPLKFTLLPPAGVTPEPVADAPTKPTGKYGNTVEEPDVFERQVPKPLARLIPRHYWGPVGAACFAMGIVIYIARWQMADDAFASTVDQIKPGAPILQVIEKMGDDPEDLGIGPNDSGELVWEYRTQGVVVKYSNGRVTSVQKTAATGGMRRRAVYGR